MKLRQSLNNFFQHSPFKTKHSILQPIVLNEYEQHQSLLRKKQSLNNQSKSPSGPKLKRNETHESRVESSKRETIPTGDESVASVSSSAITSMKGESEVALLESEAVFGIVEQSDGAFPEPLPMDHSEPIVADAVEIDAGVPTDEAKEEATPNPIERVTTAGSEDFSTPLSAVTASARPASANESSDAAINGSMCYFAPSFQMFIL